MIQVVAFLIEHFPDIHACPTVRDLGIMLEHEGFDDVEINNTLMCLNLLCEIPHINDNRPRCCSIRVYSDNESKVLLPEIRALLHFLYTSEAIDLAQHEFIIHALMHLDEDAITLENAKVLALLVLWAHQSELPILIGDELMTVLYDKGLMQ